MTKVKDITTTATVHGDKFKITIPQIYDSNGKEVFNEIIANIGNERINDCYRVRHNWVPTAEINNIKGILAFQQKDLADEIGIDKERLNIIILCDELLPPKAEKKLEYIATHLFYQGDIEKGTV